MRQTENNNITIQYPDAVGFAFLPCIIKASGSGVASIEATISRETKTYTYSVEAFADNCIMDYREYVQALFDGISFGNIDYSRESQKSNLGSVFDVSVKVKNSEGSDLATFSYDFLRLGSDEGRRDVERKQEADMVHELSILLRSIHQRGNQPSCVCGRKGYE